MNVYVFTVDDGTDHIPYLVIVAESKEAATEVAAYLASVNETNYPVRLYGQLDRPGVIVTKSAFVSEIYVD